LYDLKNVNYRDQQIRDNVRKLCFFGIVKLIIITVKKAE